LYHDNSEFLNWADNVEFVHGNTAGNQSAWLYRLETSTGEFLKWGVSQDPATRYSGSFMRGKRIIPMLEGPRWRILEIERDLVERLPGKLNKEPWRGAKAAQ
jgi:hypothetical protein